MKRIHIIGGGTLNHVRPHFALCAPAFGTFACQLAQVVLRAGLTPTLHLSKMGRGALADNPDMIPYQGDTFMTNADLAMLLFRITENKEPCLVFLTTAVCDWEPEHLSYPGMEGELYVGQGASRLKTAQLPHLTLDMVPSDKLIGQVRGRDTANPRKDIFLVGCKTTAGASDDEMFLDGLRLLKTASCNLVLVNDIHRRRNMIVTPEQARYAVGSDRESLANILVGMALSRSQGNFTRSTVVGGSPVPWTGPQVYPALREVVNHCIRQGAYKDLLGRNTTVGHFAQKLDSNRFLTSRRNTNFNHINEVGLVEVVARGDDEVVAFGSRPSVGGQSQRIIFREHPDVDCIVHAHVPLKPGVTLPTRSQLEHECGSHQCGQNTSNGLAEVEPGIKVVYLDKHGPNIVFHHSIDPKRVIDFIDRTFDLSRHTGES